jgi:hypothetical protein
MNLAPGRRLRYEKFAAAAKPVAMSRRPKPSLIDVAREAGVSMATVSRALSQPELLRADTLLRVRQAAQHLGYRPDRAARTLASGRSSTIGVVIPTLNSPIFADTLQEMQRTLAEAGYQLLVASHEYDPAAEYAAVEKLLSHGVDGLALVGGSRPDATWQLLEIRRRPGGADVVRPSRPYLRRRRQPRRRRARRPSPARARAPPDRRRHRLSAPQRPPARAARRRAGGARGGGRAATGDVSHRRAADRARRPRRLQPACSNLPSGRPRSSARSTCSPSAPSPNASPGASRSPRRCRWPASTTSSFPPMSRRR